MHRSYRVPLWGLVVLGAATAAPALAQEQPPRPEPKPIVDRTGALIVPLQGSTRLQMRSRRPIRTVFNSNENVVTVLADATDPRYVVLLGRAVGLAKLTLTDEANNTEGFDVVVQPDIELLRSLIRRAVPTANVDVIPGVGNIVILTGHVAHNSDVDIILRVAASVVGGGPGNVVNAITVGGVMQVQLDVVVARVDRSEARTRGVNFIVSGSTFSIGSILGGLVSPGGAGAAAAGGTSVGITSAAFSATPSAASNIVFGIVPAGFQGLIQALRTEGLAKLLAEPKLITQSGRPARFLSGGRQAVLGPAAGINGPGVVYEEIGTELEFLPIVYGNGKIYLEVAPRVRGVNQGLGITTSFGTVPGFDEQSVRTSIEMEPGQTFAIAGLIQNNVQASTSKVPILGDIPFIGAAFSVVSHTESEQELVILVTPHLVDPMDCHQVPKRLPGRETRSPDDFELFLESIVEAPRGQRNVFEGGRYQAAWKNDPTAGKIPCGGVGYGGGPGGTCGPNGCANCGDGVGPVGPGGVGVPVGLPGAAGPAPAPIPVGTEYLNLRAPGAPAMELPSRVLPAPAVPPGLAK